MSSSDPLETEYQNLIPIEKKRVRFLNYAILLLFLVIGVLLYSLGFVKVNDTLTRIILNTVVPSIIMILVYFLTKKGAQDPLSIQQRLFFVFYKTYKELKNYLSLRDRGNQDRARMAVIKLKRYMVSWSKRKAEPELIEVGNEIGENLGKHMLPIINQKNIQILGSICEAFIEIASSINKDGYNITNLTTFNKRIASIIPTKEQNRILKILEKHSKIGYLVFIIGGCLVTVILRIYFPKETDLLIYVSGMAALFIAVATLNYTFRQRKTA